MSENRVLGENNRVLKFDFGLADRLNKEADMADRLKPKKAKKSMDDEPITNLRPFRNKNIRGIDNIIMETHSNGEGNYASQNWWLMWTRDAINGRFMASMSDYYLAFKQAKCDLAVGTSGWKSHQETFLINFREYLKDKCIITSTRIIYDEKSLKTQIIHNYNCIIKSNIRKYTLDVLPYNGESIKQVLDTPIGLKFLQTYFETRDNKEEIMSTLEFITKISRNLTHVFMPSMMERKTPEAVAILERNAHEFHIGDYDCNKTEGRSYCVEYRTQR